MASILTICEAFGAAWNRHDLEAIMAAHSENCAFWASAGPESEGGRFEGKDAVRSAYQALFDLYPDGQWTNGRITVLNSQRALSEWRFVGTTTDQRKVSVDGLDFLEFDGSLIRLKNSYRKQRTP